MGHRQLQQDDTGSASMSKQVTGIIVRAIGIGLIIAGLVLAVFVMLEAWGLYKYPERIEAFAEAVEQGSNIDKTLAPRRTGDDLQSFSLGAAEASDESSIRLSYFFAWFIVFILMALLSRIAITAVSTGGKLALYDLEVKRLAKALTEEISRAYR